MKNKPQRVKTTFEQVKIGQPFYLLGGVGFHVKRSETTADYGYHRRGETILPQTEVYLNAALDAELRANEYIMTPEDLDSLGIPRSHTVISPGFEGKSKPSPKPETKE